MCATVPAPATVAAAAPAAICVNSEPPPGVPGSAWPRSLGGSLAVELLLPDLEESHGAPALQAVFVDTAGFS